MPESVSHDESPPAKRFKEGSNEPTDVAVVPSGEVEVKPSGGDALDTSSPDTAAPDTSSPDTSSAKGSAELKEESLAASAASCARCGKIFPNKKAVYGHKRIHSKWEPEASDLQCGNCHVTFDSVGHYECHQAMMHPPKFGCKMCPVRGLAAAEIVAHVLDHSRFAEERRKVYAEFERVE